MLRIITAMCLFATACLAQSPEPGKFYKLDFVIKEVDGAKLLSSHTFTMTVSTDPSMQHTTGIRNGSKVPVSSGSGPNAGYNYIDVGLSLDCLNVRELPSGLAMTISADMSNIPAESSATTAPVAVHQNHWNSNAFVPLQKSTLLFSSDDLTTRHQMRVEVTATPIR